MARVINQNNEVVSTKKTNTQGEKVKAKASISKTSLIVGIVLFLALVTIAIVLILVFTKKSEKEEEHTPTQLEQYVSNYQKNTKKDQKIRIISGLETQDIEEYTGECYIFVYNMEWMTELEKDSRDYKVMYNLDAALTGGMTTSDKKAVSFLDAAINSDRDIMVFIIDYKSIASDDSDDKPYFNVSTGERAEISGSPEFYHVNYTDSNDEHVNITRIYSSAKAGNLLYSYVYNETNALKTGN